MEELHAFARADLSDHEVRRRTGAYPPGHSEAMRQRLAALLERPSLEDDAPAGTKPDDARLCGALVVRMGQKATPKAIAEWMGWTLERTYGALAELARRLDACGMCLNAGRGGGITVDDAVPLRSRPQQLSFELVERLDDKDLLHALAHLVRGDHCPDGEAWQPLLDMGAAVPDRYPPVRPSDAVARAFSAARRERERLPRVVEVPDRRRDAEGGHHARPRSR